MEKYACPFCRTAFSASEAHALKHQSEGPGAALCPSCELALVPWEDLDPEQEPVQDQTLPWTYGGRGRGPLLGLSLGGLGLFFCPWFSLRSPEELKLSAFELARTNAPWLWGGAVAWFLLIPLVLSRRSLRQLWGARLIAGIFSTVSLAELTVLYTLPPSEHRYFQSGLSFEPGFWATGALSLLGVWVASRLGGKASDLRNLPLRLPSDRQVGESLN